MTEIQTTPFSKGFLEIRERWCKGCNLCASVCPKNVITIDHLGKVRVERPEDCTGCGMCEAICPDFAIRVNKNA